MIFIPLKQYKKQFWLWLFVAIFGGGLVAVFFFGVFFASDPTKVKSPLIGQPAPDFSFVDLQTNRHYQLADFKGQTLVLNIWASWCLACRTESKTLGDLYRNRGDKNLTVVGIAVKDTTAAALNFLATYPKDYPVGLDNPENNVLLTYGITGVPETFIIDEKGLIRHKFIGEVSSQDLAANLQL